MALLLAAGLLFLAGCGSKISEANYYRVQYGMTESAVDEVLGPAHQERIEAAPQSQPATAASATTAVSEPPSGRTVKTWTRGTLVISVVFENGKVVSRRSQGAPFKG
jgi:hypothetical protein